MRTRRLWIAITATTAALALAAPAQADVVDDNPAVASRGVGDMYVFARGADGSVLERHLANGAWTEWASLGGQATSGPAAAAYGQTINVFIRGPEGAIYQNVLSGSWSGWMSLGGDATSAPATHWRRGAKHLNLAMRGTDNAIHFQSFDPGRGWSGWTSLGGNGTGAPSINAHADGLVNVFARGTASDLVQQAWSRGRWLPDWLPLGGQLTTPPSAISRADGIIDVFARGPGNATYQRPWHGRTGWAEWALLDPTPIDSTPVAGSDEPGHVVLLARRGDRLMIKEWRDTRPPSTAWTPWADFGPVALPASAPPPPPGEVELEARLGCTPPGGRVPARVAVRRARVHVSRIVFFTKGRGRAIKVDRRAPFAVQIPINKPASKTGRVFARIYYRLSSGGKLRRQTVSSRYVVCRR